MFMLSGKNTNINIWVILQLAQNASLSLSLSCFVNSVVKTPIWALMARSCALRSNYPRQNQVVFEEISTTTGKGEDLRRINYKSGACNLQDYHIQSGVQDNEPRVFKVTNPSTYLESVKAGERYKEVVKFCGVQPS